MKTPQQIEEMAKEYFEKNLKPYPNYEKRLNDIFCEYIGHHHGVFVQTILELAINDKVSKAQKDLLEPASEGFESQWEKQQGDQKFWLGTGKEFCNFFWQTCALSKMKEIQEKDAEIERLNKKISSFDAYASADEKYQEAVKDIEVLIGLIQEGCKVYDQHVPSGSSSFRLDAECERLKIKTKYGLDKSDSSYCKYCGGKNKHYSSCITLNEQESNYEE